MAPATEFWYGYGAVPVSPLEVARLLAASGRRREAELLVRATLARCPRDLEARTALCALERGDGLAPPTDLDLDLDLELVDQWIREGWLVEALQLLAREELEGPAGEWANLLGELLAPVPADADPVFRDMYRNLVSGGASVALALLEDRFREAAGVPSWALRRLHLLRWMLLDNARALPSDEPEVGAPATPLVAMLREAFATRSLSDALAAVEAYKRAHPGDPSAAECVRLLSRLLEESRAQESASNLPIVETQTMPVQGRPAAAMQLAMGNLEGAANLYRKLAARQPGDVWPVELLGAVNGVLRILGGHALEEHRFPSPIERDVRPAVGALLRAPALRAPALRAPAPQALRATHTRAVSLEEHRRLVPHMEAGLAGLESRPAEPTLEGPSESTGSDELDGWDVATSEGLVIASPLHVYPGFLARPQPTGSAPGQTSATRGRPTQKLGGADCDRDRKQGDEQEQRGAGVSGRGVSESEIVLRGPSPDSDVVVVRPTRTVGEDA